MSHRQSAPDAAERPLKYLILDHQGMIDVDDVEWWLSEEEDAALLQIFTAQKSVDAGVSAFSSGENWEYTITLDADEHTLGVDLVQRRLGMTLLEIQGEWTECIVSRGRYTVRVALFRRSEDGPRWLKQAPASRPCTVQGCPENSLPGMGVFCDRHLAQAVDNEAFPDGPQPDPPLRQPSPAQSAAKVAEPHVGRFRDEDGVEGLAYEMDRVSLTVLFVPDGWKSPHRAIYVPGKPSGTRDYGTREACERLQPLDDAARQLVANKFNGETR